MSKGKQPENKRILDTNFEEKQNLLGFFDLLLKIDKRNNPEKYKNKDLDNCLDKKC